MKDTKHKEILQTNGRVELALLLKIVRMELVLLKMEKR
jgi:hypothetical protein